MLFRACAVALLTLTAMPALAEIRPAEYALAKDHLDAKAGAFTDSLINNRPDGAARQAELLSALTAYTAVVTSGTYAADSLVADASAAHVSQLEAWRPIIASTDGVMQMRPFWEQASTVLMGRLTLEEAMARATPIK